MNKTHAQTQRHKHTHTFPLNTQLHGHTALPYFLNTNTYGPILSQPPSIKSTSCAGGWNSAGLESGRPNPSVSGGRSVCHPPLWAPSSWKRERRDRGWWSYEASGFGGSSCRKRRGQELRCSPGEALLLQPKTLHCPICCMGECMVKQVGERVCRCWCISMRSFVIIINLILFQFEVVCYNPLVLLI